MRLTRKSLKNAAQWPGYRLPAFDIEAMVSATQHEPVWLHMGAGNIFRAFPAAAQQDLLGAGITNKGIIVCECYDEAIIPAVYAPQDNLSLLVTLKADGNLDKRVIASVAEALNAQGNEERLKEIFQAPTLQMVTFTITEKGYNVTDNQGITLAPIQAEIENGPDQVKTAIGVTAAGCLARYQEGSYPLALVSLDNCAQNGTKLAQAIEHIAAGWQAKGYVSQGFLDYLNNELVSYPWSMIDKITPRPSETVQAMLEADGYEDASILETDKHTFISSFVNAEACQYLVIEDSFPNGRPSLEQAGIIFAARETVEKVEQMKVCSCLNPLHTILAVSGCLLGYKTIAEAMGDRRLVSLLKQAAYKESLPVVVHPGVIDPARFLAEVLEERLPNPFIPDTPQRIACDTSQKIRIRFGETLKRRCEANKPTDELQAAPLFFALWLRYLLGIDDAGNPMPISPDPRLAELAGLMSGISLGDNGSFHKQLQPILSDASIFGVDLYAANINLGQRVEALFARLVSGENAINEALNTWL